MSVSICSPEGPVTRHFSPLSSVAVAGAYLAPAFPGCARSVSAKLVQAFAIADDVTMSSSASPMQSPSSDSPCSPISCEQFRSSTSSAAMKRYPPRPRLECHRIRCSICPVLARASRCQQVSVFGQKAARLYCLVLPRAGQLGSKMVARKRGGLSLKMACCVPPRTSPKS
jgi:hypothetical protein